LQLDYAHQTIEIDASCQLL